jgi:hypothetical protein
MFSLSPTCRYYARRGGSGLEDGLSTQAICAAQAQYKKKATFGPITSLKSMDSFPNLDGHAVSDTVFEASQVVGSANGGANCRAGNVEDPRHSPESATREVPVATADPWHGKPEKMVSGRGACPRECKVGKSS